MTYIYTIEFNVFPNQKNDDHWQVEQEDNADFLLQYFAAVGDQLPVDFEVKDRFTKGNRKYVSQLM